MTSDDIWRPPPPSSSEPDRPRSPRQVLLPALLGLSVIGGLSLATTVVTRNLDLDRPRTLPLPSTYEESQRWQGTRVPIETGTTPDGRQFRFEVSRHRHGFLCSFVMVSAPGGGGGGGGGGCGDADPISFATGSDGAVHGLVVRRVVTVELRTPTGPVTVPAKPLPEPFSERRYFLAVLPSGTTPTEVVARDAEGVVVARRGHLPGPPRRGQHEPMTLGAGSRLT